MTPEAQRIAIAEACGWTQKTSYYLDGSSAGRSWVAASGVGGVLPDYLTDLNAMHEAEKVLPANLRQTFSWKLAEVVDSDDMLWPFIHATAAQRALAFIKTLGLDKNDSA